MKGFNAFLKKDIREFIRTKRLLIIMIVFTIIGIMNPATAKLTPKILEMASEDYASMGITLSNVTVTALDSWSQFAKNISTALIVLLIMFSSIYTTEYSKGTLIPLLTKGLSRNSVVLSKFTVMMITWSAGLWLCFGITYFYSDLYWDNSVVHEILFAGFEWWLFGIFMISCIVFFSAFAASAAQVLLGTGGVYITMTLIGMYKKAKEYLPVCLTDSLPVYKGEISPSDCFAATGITVIVSLLLVISALPLTHKRQL